MDKIKKTELVIYCGLCIKNGQIRDTARSFQAMLNACNYPEWAPTMADFAGHQALFRVRGGVGVADDTGLFGATGRRRRSAVRHPCLRQRKGPARLLGMRRGQLQKIDQNQQRIREVGLEAWLVEQAVQVEAGFSYLGVFGENEQVKLFLSEVQDEDKNRGPGQLYRRGL